MKYFLWMFLPVLLLGQIRTVTQQGIKKSMIRGDLTTLTWIVPGDYSADSVLFVVKNSSDPDGVRLIRKSTGSGLTNTYSSPNTTVTVTLNTINTQGFNPATYYYDIASVTDSITLVIGILVIQEDVSSPADGVATSTPYYTVALDTPAYNPSFLIGMDTNNSWNSISKPDIRDTLGVNKFWFGLIKTYPTGSENILLFETRRNITIDSVKGFLLDSLGGTDRCDINFNFASTISGSSTKIFTVDKQITATETIFVPNTTSVPADRWIRFTSSYVEGLFHRLYLYVYYREHL